MSLTICFIYLYILVNNNCTDFVCFALLALRCFVCFNQNTKPNKVFFINLYNNEPLNKTEVV